MEETTGACEECGGHVSSHRGRECPDPDCRGHCDDCGMCRVVGDGRTACAA